MEIHPVFHVSLLDPVARDALEGHIPPKEPYVVIDGEKEYEVEEILDSKKAKNSNIVKYLVKWFRYDNPTWEPRKNITHADDLLEDFHTRYPTKPR